MPTYTLFSSWQECFNECRKSDKGEVYRNLITSKNIQYSRKDFLKGFYILIFRKWGKEGERKREKPQCVVASPVSPTGDLACNPGMCPDWESNQRSFGSQAGTQCTEPHQPGPEMILFNDRFIHSFIHSFKNY